MIDDYLAGRTAEAARAHRRLLPLMQALMTAASNPIPAEVRPEPDRLPGRGAAPAAAWSRTGEAAERIMAEVRRHHIDLAVTV